MAITNLPTKLTSAGNQGDAGDYSTAASTVFQIDYSGLDYTPKTTDDYKNDFEEELQVFINGTRIYRTATDTGIDDAEGLSTAQKSRLTNLNSTFGNEPWDIVTGTKKVQINQTHTAFGDSDSNNPGYPDLSTWTIIKVIRIKPDKTTLATDFQSASVLTEAELDNAFSETFHMAQEAVDTASDALTLDTDNVWDAESLRIKNVANGTATNDAVNKGQLNANEVTTGEYRDDALDHRDTAEDYAVRTGAVVRHFDGATNNTSDSSPSDQAGVFSAKEHAVGTTVTTGSAKSWATDPGSAQVASTDYSAKAWASDTANNIGSSKDWATKTDAVVASSDGSAKAWAIGGTGVTDTALKGAAKEWATETSSTVDTSEYSAKEYAVGIQRRGQANGGSAKDWATYTSGTVDNASYSALYHANAASESALSAKNSAAAVANVYDNFSDTFLGSMADGATASSGTANGTWSASSSSITLASTSGTIEVGQEVTGSGIPSDANILSIDGSTIVISENMTNAGSSVALTFTGQGVYGAFNSSSDGPSTDNDGNALVTGSLYFNTTDNEMRIYDGANWIAASASGSTSILIYKYVATGSQTTFTGSDANGASLSYTVNNIIVFLNGVKLDASDFTATSGTSVVLGSGATASDELVIVSFKSFTTADMVPASTGGTFAGNVSFGDNNITNVGSITLDSISADGSSITISNDTTLASGVDIETSTTGKIKQKGAFMQSSTHQALFLGY